MKKAFLIVVALLLGVSLENQAQQVIPLYEGKAPGSENWTWTEKAYATNGSKNRVIYNVVQPTLTVYLPKAKNHRFCRNPSRDAQSPQ